MDLGSFIPAQLLYVETHFRFSHLIPNLLYKPEPEVIFDIPRRIEPGAPLPVLLMVNDIARFPAVIRTVSFTISKPGCTPQLYTYADCEQFRLKHILDTQCAVYLFTIGNIDLPKGQLYVTCRADITCNGNELLVLNDNLPGSSKISYTTYSASERLPGASVCLYGDMHVHSQFSQSHVEFGPPPAVIDTMASSSGLDFAAITDHSYDLSCSLEDYLQADATGSRWNALRRDVASPLLKTILIQGEEISCLNSKGRVVHLCGYDLKDPIPGEFDGARKNRFHGTTLTLPEAVKEIRRQGGIAAAAHPGARNGILAKILLRRGTWDESDIQEEQLALQAVNEGFGPSWHRAKKLWLKKLAQGLRLPLIAGNDAHGDFNRYRAIGLPMVSLQEQFERYFGESRTGLYTQERTLSGIMKAIRDGATFVTSGPALGISSGVTLDHCVIGNRELHLSTSIILHVVAISTPEFGALRVVRVINFDSATGVERIIMEKRYTGSEYNVSEEIHHDLLASKGYLRAEALCEARDQMTTQGCTSPCYYTKSTTTSITDDLAEQP